MPKNEKTKGLSKKKILGELIRIGKPLLGRDRLDQEVLYAIQNDVADLMADVANDVPDGPGTLRKEFPWLFKVTSHEVEDGMAHLEGQVP